MINDNIYCSIGEPLGIALVAEAQPPFAGGPASNGHTKGLFLKHVFFNYCLCCCFWTYTVIISIMLLLNDYCYYYCHCYYYCCYYHYHYH